MSGSVPTPDGAAATDCGTSAKPSIWGEYDASQPGIYSIHGRRSGTRSTAALPPQPSYSAPSSAGRPAAGADRVLDREGSCRVDCWVCFGDSIIPFAASAGSGRGSCCGRSPRIACGASGGPAFVISSLLALDSGRYPMGAFNFIVQLLFLVSIASQELKVWCLNQLWRSL